MKPSVKEFTNDQALITEVQELTARGVDRTDLYVLTHDDDRTNRLADNADINTIGIEEEGLGSAVGNIFRQKGDELREKLQNMGYSPFESEELEEKLDQGKVLLLINYDSMTPPSDNLPMY